VKERLSKLSNLPGANELIFVENTLDKYGYLNIVKQNLNTGILKSGLSSLCSANSRTEQEKIIPGA
jgi:hypothetical protein